MTALIHHCLITLLPTSGTWMPVTGAEFSVLGHFYIWTFRHLWPTISPDHAWCTSSEPLTSRHYSGGFLSTISEDAEGRRLGWGYRGKEMGQRSWIGRTLHFISASREFLRVLVSTAVLVCASDQNLDATMPNWCVAVDHDFQLHISKKLESWTAALSGCRGRNCMDNESSPGAFGSHL